MDSPKRMAKSIIGANDWMGPVPVDTDELAEPAPLEHSDDHAVAGADRQQVHDRRLDRHEHRAEHHEQQQERKPDDDAHEQRQPPAAEMLVRSL